MELPCLVYYTICMKVSTLQKKIIDLSCLIKRYNQTQTNISSTRKKLNKYQGEIIIVLLQEFTCHFNRRLL